MARGLLGRWLWELGETKSVDLAHCEELSLGPFLFKNIVENGSRL
jgi:hypothetical protein